MEFTVQQKSEIVKLYFQFKSPAIVMELMSKKYPATIKLQRQHIKRIVKRFEKAGSVSDGRHCNVGRSKQGGVKKQPKR